MKIQKMLLAVVVGFIVMFVLAGLFHLVIMKEYFISKVGPMNDVQYALISYGILAILMSYMFPKGYQGGSLIKEGLVFGILMGLTCRVPWEVLEIGYGRGDWNFVMTEALWHSVEEGVGGIAIAMVYGKSMMVAK